MYFRGSARKSNDLIRRESIELVPRRQPPFVPRYLRIDRRAVDRRSPRTEFRYYHVYVREKSGDFVLALPAPLFSRRALGRYFADAMRAGCTA